MACSWVETSHCERSIRNRYKVKGNVGLNTPAFIDTRLRIPSLHFWICTLLIPCIFLQLIRQQKNAPNKIQFVTGIKLLHVSASGCHLQGDLEQRNIRNLIIVLNSILLNAFLVDVLIIIIIIINLAPCFDLAAIIWPIEICKGYICEYIMCHGMSWELDMPRFNSIIWRTDCPIILSVRKKKIRHLFLSSRRLKLIRMQLLHETVHSDNGGITFLRNVGILNHHAV
jgi:hypothetical protein